jgi:hypothetical protein
MPAQNAGAGCNRIRQCSSGYCSDSVCCNMACAGGCDACSAAAGASADGTCTILGAGNAGSPSCSPYVCDGAVGGCPATCNVDTDCATNFYCTGTGGTCMSAQSQGASCNRSRQCANGNCVDNFCCNMDSTTCTGCKACSNTLTGGANGTCGNVKPGLDHGSFCANTPPNVATCIAAVCNGQGTCAAANGVQCNAVTCVNTGTIGQYTSTLASQTCDGTTVGSCPVHSSACAGGYDCNSGACRTSCTVDADCLATYFCNVGATTCTARLANGTAGCANNITGNTVLSDQCTSNVCASGTCRQCSSGRECTVAAAACTANACAACSSTGNCTTPGLGDACASGTCTCSGGAACINPRALNCTGGGTKTCQCGTSGACPVGQYCTGSANTDNCLMAPNQPCQGNTDCISGTCTAGACARLPTNSPCLYSTDCTNGICQANFTCN